MPFIWPKVVTFREDDGFHGIESLHLSRTTYAHTNGISGIHVATGGTGVRRSSNSLITNRETGLRYRSAPPGGALFLLSHRLEDGGGRPTPLQQFLLDRSA